jgi:glycine/D-amino acid oxidase-like deaminating enzyme
MRVVICGGGVIGAATAYFLARRGVRVVVVEGTAPACAASGKAGGFLARDWCDATPLEALARRSFALHAQLCDELGGDWGYRRLTTYGGTVGGEGERPRHRLSWLAADVAVARRLGSPQTTAQVHPRLFTEALLHAAEARGAELLRGRVTGLASTAGRACGVEVDGRRLAADAVVIATGPWSLQTVCSVDLPQVFALKGHSLLFATGTGIPAEALFLEVVDDGGVQSPEVFPRADGTTYVCAISSDSPLPDNAAQVAPDRGAMARLHAICARLSPVLAEAKVLAQQACYRPITADGLPLIGAIPGLEGAYLATGHSVWGILNAPATGEAMAELITGAPCGIALQPFDPGRFYRGAGETKLSSTRNGQGDARLR